MNINEILHLIETKNIDLQTIESYNLNPYEKIILTSAYYERNGKRKYACYILNKIAGENAKNRKLLLIIKLLLERLKINHKFNITPYLSIIDYTNNLYKDKYDSEIQDFTEYLNLLEKNEMHLEILLLTSCKKYKDNETIQRIRINTLLKENRLNDCLKICLNPQFKNNPTFQEILEEIVQDKSINR